jgi:hypothetical protein
MHLYSILLYALGNLDKDYEHGLAKMSTNTVMR